MKGKRRHRGLMIEYLETRHLLAGPHDDVPKDSQPRDHGGHDDRREFVRTESGGKRDKGNTTRNSDKQDRRVKQDKRPRPNSNHRLSPPTQQQRVQPLLGSSPTTVLPTDSPALQTNNLASSILQEGERIIQQTDSSVDRTARIEGAESAAASADATPRPGLDLARTLGSAVASSEAPPSLAERSEPPASGSATRREATETGHAILGEPTENRETEAPLETANEPLISEGQVDGDAAEIVTDSSRIAVRTSVATMERWRVAPESLRELERLLKPVAREQQSTNDGFESVNSGVARNELARSARRKNENLIKFVTIEMEGDGEAHCAAFQTDVSSVHLTGTFDIDEAISLLALSQASTKTDSMRDRILAIVADELDDPDESEMTQSYGIMEPPMSLIASGAFIAVFYHGYRKRSRADSRSTPEEFGRD